MFMSDQPRTPLLHEGQFGADIASVAGLREEETDRFYRAPQNWSSEVFQGRDPAVRGTVNRSPSRSEVGGGLQSSTTLAVIAPEMSQRRTQLPSRGPVPLQFQVPTKSAVDADGRTSPRRRAQRGSKDSDKEKKKNMLASALRRATEAVDLDNVHDFPSALIAYGEACEYLSQVADRSSSEVDKQKLRDIVCFETAHLCSYH